MDKRKKIFGIGLSRTATTSLTRCLKILGYKSIHYPYSVLKIKNDGKLDIDMQKVSRFDALTDTPIAHFYKKLDKRFPGSKFILTIRDTKDWLYSIKKHFIAIRPLKITRKMDMLDKEIYGSSRFDEEIFKKAYEMHIQDVMKYFRHRPKDLLIMNICEGDGWEKLCNHLDRPLPEKKKVPFTNPGHHKIPSLIMNNIKKAFGYNSNI